jgi:uncharacterized protein HemY
MSIMIYIIICISGLVALNYHITASCHGIIVRIIIKVLNYVFFFFLLLMFLKNGISILLFFFIEKMTKNKGRKAHSHCTKALERQKTN